MKVFGISFLDNGTYSRIKLLNDCITINGNRVKDTFKVSPKFSYTLRGIRKLIEKYKKNLISVANLQLKMEEFK